MTTLLLKNSINIEFGFDGLAVSYVVIECRFNSNGEEFVAIGMYPTMQVSGGVLDYIKADGTEVTVYRQPNDVSIGYWVNQAYRTVTFVEDVDDNSLLGWLERNKATKQFTRLYSGDVAYSNNGKRFRKLQNTESIVGTWLLNEQLSYSFGYDGLTNIKSNITANYYDGFDGKIIPAALYNFYTTPNYIGFGNGGIPSWYETYFYSDKIAIRDLNGTHRDFTYSSEYGKLLRTITINEQVEFYGDDIMPEQFCAWLKVNATKIA